MNLFIGIKSQMGQAWDAVGKRVAITKVVAKPMHVLQIKDVAVDGYDAIQVGISERSMKRVSKPLKLHLKKNEANQGFKFIKEIQTTEKDIFQPGTKINLESVLSEGDVVTVSGVSKGAGFAGVVKRHGFKGGPKTHGQSDRQRAPGSIGQGTTPGRVHKGKKMAGHLGSKRVTYRNLKVVKIDKEKAELWLSGPIPGKNGSMVTIRKSSANEVVKI